jgi:hypothetical protein
MDVGGWTSEPEFDVLKGKQTFLGSGESVRNAYPLYVTKASTKVSAQLQIGSVW